MWRERDRKKKGKKRKKERKGREKEREKKREKEREGEKGRVEKKRREEGKWGTRPIGSGLPIREVPKDHHTRKGVEEIGGLPGSTGSGLGAGVESNLPTLGGGRSSSMARASCSAASIALTVRSAAATCATSELPEGPPDWPGVSSSVAGGVDSAIVN